MEFLAIVFLLAVIAGQIYASIKKDKAIKSLMSEKYEMQSDLNSAHCIIQSTIHRGTALSRNPTS